MTRFRYLRIFLLAWTAIAATMLVRPVPVYSQDRFDEGALFERLTYREKPEYRVIRLFMSEKQKREFLSIDDWWQRRLWVERFWLELDPTPTTRQNEKKLEVDERIKLAKELFMAEEEPGWDHRGYVFIRYGVPDYWNRIWGTISGGDLTMPGEIWHYSAPDTTIRFIDNELDGYFTIDYPDPDHGMWIPTQYDAGFRSSSRKTLDDIAGGFPLTASKGPGSTGDIDFDIQTESNELPGKVEMLCERYGLEGYWPTGDENSYFLFPELDLNLIAFFDISTFRKDDAVTRAEISFEVPGSELEFEKDGEILKCEVELRVVVRDEEMEKVSSSEESFSMSVEGEPDPGRFYMLGQSVLELSKGQYSIWIEAVEKNSSRRGILKTGRNIFCYGDTLAISDIQFAKTIRESDATSRYRKNDLIVIPHPLHLYRKGFPLTFYFEIYGLDTDSEDFTFYSVEYSIEPLGKKEGGLPAEQAEAVISSKFNSSGFGSIQPQRFEIATEELWEGRFRLNIGVMDRRTRQVVHKDAAFSIID